MMAIEAPEIQVVFATGDHSTGDCTTQSPPSTGDCTIEDAPPPKSQPFKRSRVNARQPQTGVGTTGEAPVEVPAQPAAWRQCAEPTRGRGRLPYASPRAEAPLRRGMTKSIHTGSSPIENDRQLSTVAPDDSASLQVTEEYTYTSAPSVLGTISAMLGMTLHEQSRVCTGHSNVVLQKRDLRIRLSMDDPSMSVAHRTAHQLFVTGRSVSELRGAGVTALHLQEVGVTYNEWSRQCGLGVRDLVFLEAEWQHIVRMGFLPTHIVQNRDQAGPVVLAGDPLNVTMDMLEENLGLTVDEAVCEIGFSAADFGVLGETFGSLCKRGFTPEHITHMREPRYNFEVALGASPEELVGYFPASVQPDQKSSRRGVVPPQPLVEPPSLMIRRENEAALARPRTKDFQFIS